MNNWSVHHPYGQRRGGFLLHMHWLQFFARWQQHFNQKGLFLSTHKRHHVATQTAYTVTGKIISFLVTSLYSKLFSCNTCSQVFSFLLTPFCIFSSWFLVELKHFVCIDCIVKFLQYIYWVMCKIVVLFSWASTIPLQ